MNGRLLEVGILLLWSLCSSLSDHDIFLEHSGKVDFPMYLSHARALLDANKVGRKRRAICVHVSLPECGVR